MKKLMFFLKPHSVVDVITNSSSELFVGTSPTKTEMESLLQEVYPNYRNEYQELRNMEEITEDELETFIVFYCSPFMWPARKDMYPILPGFTFDELYQPEDEKSPWTGECQYELKNNLKKRIHKWDSSFVTKENFEEIKNKLDPKREMYFLFSIYDNPDWEMQEKLSTIMTRLHLG